MPLLSAWKVLQVQANWTCRQTDGQTDRQSTNLSVCLSLSPSVCQSVCLSISQQSHLLCQPTKPRLLLLLLLLICGTDTFRATATGLWFCGRVFGLRTHWLSFLATTRRALSNYSFVTSTKVQIHLNDAQPHFTLV